MNGVFSATYGWTGACSLKQTVTRHSLCVLLALACSVIIGTTRSEAQTQTPTQTQTQSQPPDQPAAAATPQTPDRKSVV